MQRYWLSLLTLATLGLLAAGTDAAGPVSSSPFAPLERLDTAARATWVEDSLGRLDEANRVVLAPAAVAKQRARLGQTLDSFVKNQADWQVQVARFESELALSQRAAIEHLTRRYRMDAYEAFRGDRDGYDVRRSQLERMLADWRSCRSPSAEQHKVIRWLTTAANHLADRGTPLPPLPRFEGAGATRIATDSSRPPESRLEAWMSATRAPAPPALLLPDVEFPTPLADPRSSEPLSGPRPADLLAGRAAAPPGGGSVRPTAFHTRPRVDLPLEVHGSTPRPHHVAMLPTFEKDDFTSKLKPAAVAYSSRHAWRQPSSVAMITRPVSNRQPPFAGRSAPALPDSSRDPLAFARTRVDRFATVPAVVGETAAANGPGSPRMTQAAPPSQVYGQTGYDSDVSSSSHFYPTAVEGSSASANDSATSAGASDDRALMDEKASPNIDELASRIRGNNVALRKLAAQLYEERSWNAESLTAILDAFAPLMARKDDLKLIRELVPPQERDRVGELESGSELISDLGSKIARARSQVKDGKYEGSLVDREKELKQLDVLSRKLSDMVFSSR